MHVSIYQGSVLGTYFLDPQPFPFQPVNNPAAREGRTLPVERREAYTGLLRMAAMRAGHVPEY